MYIISLYGNDDYSTRTGTGEWLLSIADEMMKKRKKCTSPTGNFPLGYFLLLFYLPSTTTTTICITQQSVGWLVIIGFYQFPPFFSLSLLTKEETERERERESYSRHHSYVS
jgi:hypothetical protein